MITQSLYKAQQIREKNADNPYPLQHVISTVSDRAIPQEISSSGNVSFYQADIKSYSDYYPFGMQMPGRFETAAGHEYRYGQGGQEKESEITGSESHYSAEYWMYDSRLGRRWNVDPMFKNYPGHTPFKAFYNNPLYWIDPKGLNETKYYDEDGVLIENLNDGIDQSVMVNREQYQSAKNIAKTAGLDVDNQQKDAKIFTTKYDAKSKMNSMIKFQLRGNFPTIEDVLEGKEYFPYIDNCHTAADNQCRITGAIPADGTAGTWIDIYNQNGITGNTQDAIRAIQEDLAVGYAVKVGVNYLQGGHPPNPNPITDHYVAISGMGNDFYGNFFIYYDNTFDGPYNPHAGRHGDGDNKFYVNGEKMIDQQVARYLTFIVTSVFPNVKK